jgi:hypothetical protein
MTSDEPTPLDRLRATGASDAVIAAVDILVDDGYPVDRAAQMAVAAERDGKDPEAFARHLLKLRGVLRG